MTTSGDEAGTSSPRAPGPAVATGREGPLLWWRVGARRVEMFPTAGGWETRVRDPDWGDVTLRVDGHFAGEDEARVWCVTMAAAWAADAEDEARE
jgi:hypothetical protein